MRVCCLTVWQVRLLRVSAGLWPLLAVGVCEYVTLNDVEGVRR